MGERTQGGGNIRMEYLRAGKQTLGKIPSGALQGPPFLSAIRKTLVGILAISRETETTAEIYYRN